MPFKKGNTLGKSNSGKKLTEGHKDKLRKAHLGKKSSKEHKRKISEKMKGRNITWGDKISKASKGKPKPNETGELNGMWSGEDVKYGALHSWVRRHKKLPEKCEHCETTTAKRLEWANIDHTYNRRLDDFIALCPKCHKEYDKQFKNNYGTSNNGATQQG